MRHIIFMMVFMVLLSLFALSNCSGTANQSSYKEQVQNLSATNAAVNESSSNTNLEKIAAELNLVGNYDFRYGKYFNSIDKYNKSIKAYPSYVDPWNNKGAALVLVGKYHEAIKCFDKAIELSPKNAVPWNNKGDCLYRMGNITEAQAYFNHSIELDQINAVAWSNKGTILADLGRINMSLDCYNESLSLNYYSPAAWNGKGVVLAEKGKLNESLDCFYKAATLKPDYNSAWFNGGVVLHKMGMEARSQEAFAKARSMGYDKIKHDYDIQTEPMLMNVSSKKLTDTSGAFTVALLVISGHLVAPRRRFSLPPKIDLGGPKRESQFLL